MKIGIAAAFGCGKTTLLAQLEGLSPFAGIRCDLSSERRMRAALPSADTYSFQSMLVFNELLNCSLYENYATDNPLPLVQVYTELAAKTACGERYEWLLNTVAMHMPVYDLLIYIPPEIPLRNDKFRLTDNALRQKVDCRLQAILAAGEAPVLTVSGTIEERAQCVCDYLTESRTV